MFWVLNWSNFQPEHTKTLKVEDDFKDIPTIAVTAFWLESQIGEIIDAGCNNNLGNPIFIIFFWSWWKITSGKWWHYFFMAETR